MTPIMQQGENAPAMTALDPKLASKVLPKGTELVEHGVTDFSAWSRLMVIEFGREICPHLEGVWEFIRRDTKAPNISADDSARYHRPARTSKRLLFGVGGGIIVCVVLAGAYLGVRPGVARIRAEHISKDPA